MNKKVRKYLALAACLPLILSLFGCGEGDTPDSSEPVSTVESSSPAPTQTNLSLADTVWGIDNVQYVFHADGSLSLTDGEFLEVYDYSWNGQRGTAEIQGMSYTLYQKSGSLYISNPNGADDMFLYLGEYTGQELVSTPDDTSSAETSSEPEDTSSQESVQQPKQRNIETIPNDDDTIWYCDYDKKIQLSYPNDMTVLFDSFDDRYDGILVTDGKNGYLYIENVTEDRVKSKLSDGDYIQNFFDTTQYELSVELYGAWEDGSYALMPDTGSFNGSLELIQSNTYNAKYNINGSTVLYRLYGDNYMMLCYLRPFGEAGNTQFNRFFKEIRHISYAEGVG